VSNEPDQDAEYEPPAIEERAEVGRPLIGASSMVN
jgi:hypothetical protein